MLQILGVNQPSAFLREFANIAVPDHFRCMSIDIALEAPRNGRWARSMNEVGTCADERAVPGELMTMVAGGLSGQGFHVALPDSPDERELTITNIPGVRSCRLYVGDRGDVEWDYPAPEGQKPDPKRIADVVTAVLSGDTGPHERLGRGSDNASITFKGIVGLELKARGFTVGLDVHEDYFAFTVTADIYVIPPGSCGLPMAYVNDDGVVTWINEYDHGLSGEEAIARDIVDTVTRAVRMAYGEWPQPQARRVAHAANCPVPRSVSDGWACER
jgi:hypothetical protein